MTYAPVELLTVYLEGAERRKVGRLALHQRRILFEYDSVFLASGIEISPLKLPLKPGVFTSAGDIGAIEYAYSLMAGDAGVAMPPTHLFRTRKRRYFGAKRFDRHGAARIHMHSLSGLIHADHRVLSLDYNVLLRVVLVLTKNIVEVEKAYALACFNVLAHNRDGQEPWRRTPQRPWKRTWFKERTTDT